MERREGEGEKGRKGKETLGILFCTEEIES